MEKNLNLDIFHSTWAMERRHPKLPEWSLAEQCEMVASAGFQGFNIDPETPFIPDVKSRRAALANAGLGCSICAFPASLEDVRASLNYCVEIDAKALVINARIFPFSPEDAVPFVENALELGRNADVAVQFETHRFTLTNDLLFTYQLLDLCPDLDLVADLSHYVVGREIPLPVDKFHQNLISGILSRCVSIQGRVASREQIQVPIHFPQHQPWVSQFYQWWEQGMRSFIERAAEGSTFNFTCELGPPDYAITDSQGFELSDRWSEGNVFREQIDRTWNKLVNERE